MKTLVTKILIFSFLIALLIQGCGNTRFEENDMYIRYGNGIEEPAAILEKINGLNIYFGHQSVGFDILSGIQLWEEETGVQIQDVQSTDFANLLHVPLVHFTVGENGDPYSKIDEFVSLAGQIPVEGDAIAFFKFCYVDIQEDTDVDRLFEYYREKMLYLKESYPHIRFMASTVPVMGRQKGLKAFIKKLLGKEYTGWQSNLKRNEFNKKLLGEFQGSMPVFDLGGIEATTPDGRAVTHTYKGKDYPIMLEYYTYDLGHLSEFGSRTLAYNLLAFLAGEF
jgi:hypothetical protein